MFEKISELSETRKGLYFILLASLFIKILALIIMHDMAINRDGTQYIAAAQQFAQGNFLQGFAFHRMPFYSLIIMIVDFVVRNWLVSARLISIVSMTLAIIPLYLITKDLFNRKAAFWAGLAFCFAPEPNQLALEVLRDPVFIFCLLWSVYFALRAIKTKEIMFFFFAAVFSYIPFLFRIEGIIFPPFYFMFLVCILSIFIFNPQERMFYLKGLIIWCAFSLLLIIPLWFIFGAESISINKIDSITQEMEKIAGLRIGQNYRNIYDQLKTLESMSFYPSGNQNFAEVARHYMPLIYIIGLLEVLIKNVFVFFVIPLIWGLRSSYSRAHAFLIAFAGFYVLVIFYTYIERDFIQTRFLLAPAILFYPWIGAGIKKIVSSINESVRSKLIISVCVILFVLMPLGKFTRTMANEDRSICRAGEWIKANSKLQRAKFYTNDSRVGFHSGWTRGDFEKVARKYNNKKLKQGVSLEHFAVKNKIDLIVLRISKKKLRETPKFINYKKLKEFEGKKKIVFIYCSSALCQTLDK